MSKPSPRPLAENRRARHDYNILETYEAGLVLRGTEAKSIRNGKIQLKDGYVEIRAGEAFLVNVHISPYSHGNRENPDPERPRKLLLSKREINRLIGRLQTKGLTAVPLKIYLKGNWLKAEIGLGQGKKLYDKREAEKKKEMDREMQEALKFRSR